MSRKRKELPVLNDVEITGFAAEGRAVAKIRLRPEDERQIVVFVPYAAPGDIADIRLTRKKHSFAEGVIQQLITPSPERVEPRCRHFGICGGCKWQHLPYDAQLRYKEQQVNEVLRRISGINLPESSPILGSEAPWAYRNKMEYTFADRRWRTRDELESGMEFQGPSQALGFHIPGAFDKVLHINECLLQDDLGNRIRNHIFDYALSHNLSFYNIRGNSGLLRTLMIRIASTGEVMTVISFGAEPGEEGMELLADLQREFPEITSLGYVVNLKLNDTISDQKVIMVKGPEYIVEEMEGLKFRVNAKSFYQTNSRQAYELYKAVRRLAGLNQTATLPPQERPIVYDLYTGAGTIANFVAHGARKVVGIEYVKEATDDARVNSEINGIDNTTFHAGDMKDVLTTDFINSHGHPDVMVIDPPRAGMHEDVTKVILEASPKVIVYVSCNPATQARDLALLAGKYIVTDIQPVDMFPHTHHVENICRLQLIETQCNP